MTPDTIGQNPLRQPTKPVSALADRPSSKLETQLLVEKVFLSDARGGAPVELSPDWFPFSSAGDPNESSGGALFDRLQQPVTTETQQRTTTLNASNVAILSTWLETGVGEDPILSSFGLLHDALLDLDSIDDAAKEEELQEPDAAAIANARSLLPKLFEILPVRYRVSPTERRGVAIDAPMRHGASVAVECAPDDTVYCFVAIDGNSRRAKFYQMDGLPDVFIEKALRDLGTG